MSRLKTGRKLLRPLFLMAVLGLLLAGCAANRYEAVDLSGTEGAQETTAVGDRMSEPGDGDALTDENAYPPAEADGAAQGKEKQETMVALVIGEDGTFVVDKSGSGQASSAEEPEETTPADPYEAVNETVEVIADVLNVRAEDRTDARIYVQLKAGDRLTRIGKTEEWSRVSYNGKTAYVASDMVAVVEDEPETAAQESPAAEAAASVLPPVEGENGDGSPNGGQESGETWESEPEIPWNGHTVAVDAGRQAKANAEKEPIGPSSTTMKAKMAEGAVGVSSGVKEYELTLTIAQKLETELKLRGYQVVMIRTGHDVNLSNAERSVIANQSGAEILLRLYGNSMDNSGIYGALTMCMTAQNPYNAQLHDKSYTLSKKIVDNICAQTGTKNRGVQEVDNSGAINWSEIPVSVVEMGFLSNPDEDRWLQDDGYQNKLVTGIADAVDSYFAEGN